jgi:hypothetical protein
MTAHALALRMVNGRAPPVPHLRLQKNLLDLIASYLSAAITATIPARSTKSPLRNGVLPRRPRRIACNGLAATPFQVLRQNLNCALHRWKYVTSPVAAVLLWRQNEPWIAALALFWPLPGPFMLQLVIGPLNALFAQSARGKASRIGIVQRRFMAALGYENITEVADG